WRASKESARGSSRSESTSASLVTPELASPPGLTNPATSVVRSPTSTESSSPQSRLPRGSRLERRTLRLFDRRFGRALLRQQLRADLRFDVRRDGRVLDQELARVLLALTDAIAVVAVPGARLLDDVLADAEVEDLALDRKSTRLNSS